MPDERDESYREERRRKETEEPLDFSPSSGATDPSHAAQDQSEHVQTGRHAYTENATFTKEPMDAKSDEFLTLNQANRNYYADGKKNTRSEQRKQDFINDISTWGKQIGLTDHEIDRAVGFYEESDEGWRNNHSTEAIILAAIVLAANEQSKAIRPKNPVSSQTPNMTQTYTEIRDNLNVARSSVKSCRNYLRQFL